METPILFPISPEEYWQKLSEVMDRLLSEKLNKDGYPAAPPGMTSRPLLSIKEVCVRTPIKLTTSGRSKLTTCFTGEEFQFMSCQAVHKN